MSTSVTLAAGDATRIVGRMILSVLVETRVAVDVDSVVAVVVVNGDE